MATRTRRRPPWRRRAYLALFAVLCVGASAAAAAADAAASSSRRLKLQTDYGQAASHPHDVWEIKHIPSACYPVVRIVQSSASNFGMAGPKRSAGMSPSSSPASPSRHLKPEVSNARALDIEANAEAAGQEWPDKREEKLEARLKKVGKIKITHRAGVCTRLPVQMTTPSDTRVIAAQPGR